jgi:BirA family biotin operon repressor/biotin-[acetyl-CoA-carboxylase] ligase
VLPDDLDRCRADFTARGRACRVVLETGSTNDDAKSWAAEGAPDGAVVIADTQRSGRGRHGRSWSSPPGESLAISIVLRPSLAPTALPPIALVAGLAARRAIAQRVEGALVKWPNDVVITSEGRARKIAGVLVEASLSGRRVEHVIVGIGVNVARREFPSELAHATSLAREGASDLDRGALAVDLCAALDGELAEFMRDPARIGDRVAAYDAIRERRVVLEDGARGVAAGIESDGRLRVLLDSGTLRLAMAGEVRIDDA